MLQSSAHVATQCNMLQHGLPTRGRGSSPTDRAIFHTGECEMHPAGTQWPCTHARGVWVAARRQRVTGEGLSESQVRQGVGRDGTTDLHRKDESATRCARKIRQPQPGRPARKVHASPM